jgi:hypothetical protein
MLALIALFGGTATAKKPLVPEDGSISRNAHPFSKLVWPCEKCADKSISIDFRIPLSQRFTYRYKQCGSWISRQSVSSCGSILNNISGSLLRRDGFASAHYLRSTTGLRTTFESTKNANGKWRQLCRSPFGGQRNLRHCAYSPRPTRCRKNMPTSSDAFA